MRGERKSVINGSLRPEGKAVAAEEVLWEPQQICSWDPCRVSSGGDAVLQLLERSHDEHTAVPGELHCVGGYSLKEHGS